MLKNIILTFALLLLSSIPTLAAEQRCTDLGAECVCSEPLNTNSLVLSPDSPTGSGFYNPADSTTKECRDYQPTSPDLGGLAILTPTARDLFASNSGEEITNLPAGHTNTYVARRPEGHTGGWELGTGFDRMPAGKARFAARWYIYYSAVYDYAFENSCTNGKIANIYGAVGTNSGLTISMNGVQQPGAYSFFYWSPQHQDCCGFGPSNDGFSIGTRGKWWRIEAVVRRPNGDGNTTPGTGTVIEVYFKNVTDNGPEHKLIDTTVTVQGNPTLLAVSSANQTFDFRPFSGIISHPYRAGTCAGFNAHSYYMAAAWDTDAGQRILAATEIEGGGGATSSGSLTLTP